MSITLERINPGIGDASFITKHKRLVQLLDSQFSSAVLLETWCFQDAMCGGYIYRFTLSDAAQLEKLTNSLEQFQFQQSSGFSKGKLVDNHTLCADTDNKQDIW